MDKFCSIISKNCAANDPPYFSEKIRRNSVQLISPTQLLSIISIHNSSKTAREEIAEMTRENDTAAAAAAAATSYGTVTYALFNQSQQSNCGGTRGSVLQI